MQSKKQIIVNNQSLSTQKSAVSRKKRTKAKDSHRIVDEVEMLDGELKLVRTTKSGQFWSMSFWLREEGKCYRRSLRTRNLDEAKQLAFDKYIQIKADIKLGNRVFTKTAEELVQDFIKHKTDEAKAGLITEGRVQTITISLNRWFLKYVGQNKKLDKITRHDFKEYYSWRRKQAPNSVSDLKLINQTQNKLKIIFRGSELRCTCAKRTWGGPCELCQGSDNEIYSLRNFFRQIRNAKKHNMTPTEVQEFIKNTKKHVKAA